MARGRDAASSSVVRVAGVPKPRARIQCTRTRFRYADEGNLAPNLSLPPYVAGVVAFHPSAPALVSAPVVGCRRALRRTASSGEVPCLARSRRPRRSRAAPPRYSSSPSASMYCSSSTGRLPSLSASTPGIAPQMSPVSAPREGPRLHDGTTIVCRALRRGEEELLLHKQTHWPLLATFWV